MTSTEPRTTRATRGEYTTAMITAPTSVVLRRTSSVVQPGPARRGVAARRGSASTLMRVAVSLVPHPRVEDQIGEVDGEVDQHVHAGDAEHDALDDRVVAPQNGRD